tara:strand:+ start:43 stop:3624 length:3582 start_codon:yes stop_codon:yes gene_type:complete
MARKVWKIDKFDGGLNDYSDPKDIKANEFTNLQDVYISKAGSIQPLGATLNDTTLPKTAIGVALTAGQGAYALKTNNGFEVNYNILGLEAPTDFTISHTTQASDGEYARAQFKLVSMVWAFTSSNSNAAPEGYYYHDDLIKGQGALKFTMYLDSTAITTEQTILSLDGSKSGSSTWWDDKTLNATRTAAGTDLYMKGVGNIASNHNWANPYNIWSRELNLIPGNETLGPEDIAGSFYDIGDLNFNGFFYQEDVTINFAIDYLGMSSGTFYLYGITDNGLNSRDKPLGNHLRFGLGPYNFRGFEEEDFSVPPGGNLSDYLPFNAGGNMDVAGAFDIVNTSKIIKPVPVGYHSNLPTQQSGTVDVEDQYQNVICATYKNLLAAINTHTGTSGVQCQWTDGDNGDQLAGLEIWATAVGTAFNNDNIEFTLNSSGLEGTVTQANQTRGTSNVNLLSTEDNLYEEYTQLDVDKGNGVVLAGQTFMSGGLAITADIYSITFSGATPNGNIINISINPTGANVTQTDIQIINNFTSLADLATEVASQINAISTITASSDGAVVTVTGTTTTANGFEIEILSTPDEYWFPPNDGDYYIQTEEDDQYILLSKSGVVQSGSTTKYKSIFKIYSTNNGSWEDIFSDEEFTNLNEKSLSFFNWYYLAAQENKPVFINNGQRVFIAESNFNLDNENKYFSFIDNSSFFNDPAPSDNDNNGFQFKGRTFGFFIENSAKKWVFTEGSTVNSKWDFPDNMGVRIDANGNVTTNYSQEKAKMEFKIYAGTTDGVDWTGNIKVYLAAVYDDGSESLPGHQFTFSGGAETLDLSAELSTLKIECSIRPQNDAREFLFNDRRITGVRLYYTSDEDDFEIFYNLGLVDFNKGFMRASEVQTLDDTTGNASRYVWSSNGTTVSPSVRLWDIDAASNNQIIEYKTQPRMDDYTSINQIELSGTLMPTTLDVRYKTICVAGRRAFIGNLKVKDNNGTRYYNDRMIFSPQNIMDIFPNTESNILDIETHDGDEIIALASYGDRVLQYKKNILYILDITGEASNWTVTNRELYKGILNNQSFCQTGEGVFWFNEYGAYMYDGEEIKNLFSSETDKLVNRIDLKTWSDFVSSESMCGFNPKSKEILVIKKTTHATETDGDCYVYNLMTESWVKGANKFYTGSNITNFINIGDLKQLGFFTTTDLIPPEPKGETNQPGVPF